MSQSSAKRRAVLPRAATPSVGSREEPVRVFIVAPDRLFAEALCLLLSREPGLAVVGEAGGGAAAVARVARVKADVLLVDPRLPDADYADVIRLVTRRTPGTKVVLLTASCDGAEICRALKAGARGYVSRQGGVAAVVTAIRGVHRGETWVEPTLIAEALSAAEAPSASDSDTRGHGGGALTAREREILRQLAAGGSNRHIAEALFISEKTVKTHLHHIFRKLNVTGRLQAVVHAVRLGLRQP